MHHVCFYIGYQAFGLKSGYGGAISIYSGKSWAVTSLLWCTCMHIWRRGKSCEKLWDKGCKWAQDGSSPTTLEQWLYVDDSHILCLLLVWLFIVSRYVCHMHHLIIISTCICVFPATLLLGPISLTFTGAHLSFTSCRFENNTGIVSVDHESLFVDCLHKNGINNIMRFQSIYMSDSIILGWGCNQQCFWGLCGRWCCMVVRWLCIHVW